MFATSSWTWVLPSTKHGRWLPPSVGKLETTTTDCNRPVTDLRASSENSSSNSIVDR